MVARNIRYKSARPAPAKLVYDGERFIGSIDELTVQDTTDDSISLSWKYEGAADGFNVDVHAPWPYPNLASRTTKTKNITLRLAPEVQYQFTVSNSWHIVVGRFCQFGILFFQKKSL